MSYGLTSYGLTSYGLTSYGLTLAGIAVANGLAMMSPGPAFLLVTRAAAGRSRAIGVATGLGVAAAAAAWAVAATFGAAVLLTRLATLYGLLQLAGGAYLVWLGLAAWHGAGTPPETPAAAVAAEAAATPGRLGRAWLTGLSLTLTNPKVVVFFSSIFVALLPADAPLPVRLAALAIIIVQETAWFVLVACLFSQARMQAGYRRAKGIIDRVMGTLFIGLGARILWVARI